MKGKSATKASQPKKKLKKSVKIVIVILIIVVIIVIASIAAGRIIGSKLSSMTDMNQYIELQQVEKRDLSEAITISGTVQSADVYNMTSAASAEITSVSVSVGDKVKKGDVICTLNQEDIEDQIRDMENQISNASAITKNQYTLNERALRDAKQDQSSQLSVAQTEINAAQGEYDSAVAAYNTAISSYESLKAQAEEKEKELNKINLEEETYQALKAEHEALLERTEAARLEAENINASLSGLSRAIEAARQSYNSTKIATDRAIEAAQNTVNMQKYTDGSDGKSLQMQLEELKKQLEDCTVRAQIDGIITAMNVKNGDTNTPGAVIATIEDDSTLILNGSVDESDILKLEEGMEAVVSSSAIDEKEYDGTVTKVIKVASQSAMMNMGEQGEAGAATSYSAEIKIKDSDLLIGMSAKAKITLKERKNVLCVPYDLIQYDEQENAYVIRAVNNGEDGSYTAEKVNVTPGEEINYYTEITSGDLNEGDYIVFNTEIGEGDSFHAIVSSEEE